MPKFLGLLLLLCCSFTLTGARLSERLKLLYPGESSTIAAERRYLGKQLENVFRKLRYTDRLPRRSADERLSLIKARYRRDILRWYHERATPADAFRSGHFNDATASLLLALALEEFDLPFTAHVDHWEVYLRTAQGTIHHPTARLPTAEARRSYRREYLNLLRQTLPGVPSDLSEGAADSLYASYHFSPDRPLDFGGLAAYGQYRRALLAYGRHDYRAATTLLAGFGTPAHRLLRRACTLQQAALSAPSPESYTEALFDRWRAEPDNVYLPRALLSHFDERQRKALGRSDTLAAATLYTDYRSRGGGHADWQGQLSRLYRLRRLTYFRRTDNVTEALRTAEELLADAPDEPGYRAFVADLTLSALRDRYRDPVELAGAAREAAERYEFLTTSDRYADLQLREFALRVRDRFAGGEEEAAQYALAAFRRQLSLQSGGRNRSLWTLTAFIAASNFYFARQDYAPALGYVEEALGYDPTSDFLLHQRDLLLRY